MEQFKQKISILIGVWLGGLLLVFSGTGWAQHNETMSQVLYSQFLINPACTGIDNTLAIDLFAQQQWSGVEGAPKQFVLGVHSPLNDTQMSIGGAMQLYRSGVSSVYQGNLTYSYLLKISDSNLLSLGVNGSYWSGQTGFNKLELNQYNDPNFNSSYNTPAKFNTGFGAFLYSTNYYLGVSIPYLLSQFNEDEFSIWDKSDIDRSLILSAGYSCKAGQFITLKPLALYNYYETQSSDWTIGLMVNYNNFISVGAMYHSLGRGLFSCNVSVFKNLQFRYSYGFSLKSSLVSRNTNELSLGYTIESLYKFNKNRIVTPKNNNEKSSVKSLRFF